MFTNQRQAFQHAVDLLYPFLRLKNVRANGLGDLLEQEIFEELAFFLHQYGLLHFYAVTQNFQQHRRCTLVFIQENYTFLFIQAGAVFMEEMLLLVVDLQEGIVAGTALIL